MFVHTHTHNKRVILVKSKVKLSVMSGTCTGSDGYKNTQVLGLINSKPHRRQGERRWSCKTAEYIQPVISFMMRRAEGRRKKIPPHILKHTHVEAQTILSETGCVVFWWYSWTSSLAAMYMYEEVAVRLWDRGVAQGDAKSLYKDCRKDPIPNIRYKIILGDLLHTSFYAAQPSMTRCHF